MLMRQPAPAARAAAGAMVGSRLSEDAARRLGDAQAALRALLPASPNERLVYTCKPTKSRGVQGGAS